MLVAVFHGIYRVGSVVKNPDTNAGNVGLIPGLPCRDDIIWGRSREVPAPVLELHLSDAQGIVAKGTCRLQGQIV